MQRRWLLLTVLYCFAFTFSCTVAWAAPRVFFPQMEWDWGEVYSGDQISHVFTFENKGDEILKILNLETSCGCTAAVLSEKEIAPGGTGKIQVNFNSRGYRGRVHHVVYVSTNDPTTRKIILKIHGHVQLDILIQPTNVYAGFKNRTEEHSRDITITNQGKKPIKILEITFQQPEITIESTGEQTIEPGAKLQVPIKMHFPEKGNRFVGNVSFRTDHPRHPQVVVPVRLQIMAPVPSQSMDKSPFLEQLRKYMEQKEKQKSLEKGENSQSPAAPQQ